VAYIPQSHRPFFNFPVFDIVLMGYKFTDIRCHMPGKKQVELAEQAIDGLVNSHLKDKGITISGGERQLL
jgi:iron complex transport system ATP-binding protein